MNATKCYGTREIGRCEIKGIEYVAYTDGTYSHAVLASDYDEVHDTPRNDSEWRANAYSEWCSRCSSITKQETAAVAAVINYHGLYSSDGTCSWVDAKDSQKQKKH